MKLTEIIGKQISYAKQFIVSAIGGPVGTGIFSPAANTIAVSTNGAERARIDNAGKISTTELLTTTNKVGIGTQLPDENLAIYQASGASEKIYGDGFSYLAIAQSNNASDGCALQLIKSRGTTASKSVPNSGDVVGNISFRSYTDQINTSPVARIFATADGVQAVGSTPGRLLFSTTPNGNSVPFIRLTITENGAVGIGQSNPQATLHVSGSVRVDTGTAPSAGAIDGYINVNINGAAKKIPYYNV